MSKRVSFVLEGRGHGVSMTSTHKRGHSVDVCPGSLELDVLKEYSTSNCVIVNGHMVINVSLLEKPPF